MNAWIFAGVKRIPKEEIIFDLIFNYFQTTRNNILNKKRLSELVYPRQVTQYLLMSQAQLGCVQIAKIFDCNHSTVLHNNKLVQGQLSCKLDNPYKRDVPVLIEKLHYHDITIQ